MLTYDNVFYKLSHDLSYDKISYDLSCDLFYFYLLKNLNKKRAVKIQNKINTLEGTARTTYTC